MLIFLFAGVIAITRVHAFDIATVDACVVASYVVAAHVDSIADLAKPAHTATQTALHAHAPMNNPTCIGAGRGVYKATGGLGQVDNTTGAHKRVTTAKQTDIA